MLKNDFDAHFFAFDLGDFFSASRFSEYAIATDCFKGFPAFSSAFTFSENAFLLVDFFKGMISSACAKLRN